MPSLRLRRSETYADELPMVCMACGKPAETHVRKTLSWVPEWVPVLILVAAVIHLRSIRPNEITDRSITLVRLHAKFVDAFFDQFEDEPEEPPRRASRSRGYERDDDDFDD